MITGVSKAVVLVDDQDEVRAAWSGHFGVDATLQGARRRGALDRGGPASSIPEPGGVGASHGLIERLDALADRPGHQLISSVRKASSPGMATSARSHGFAMRVRYGSVRFGPGVSSMCAGLWLTLVRMGGGSGYRI